ncbi:signal recognition particle-docking protein FtsY [Corynebacterium sp. HMSC056F09]|uniref:signal recognition particle-docking protein FtsY n=1 Tax=unclassified Corynebacterium TaxID=2624378 RepID=UPI0008A660DF|nr:MULTISPECIES: signal recognition particle-docking protein FtsY [unclassified Corynebacterium]OFN76706.1 signal recognition particle-docking protein FtsY [Corynebacterium sp. HMSC070E08]OFO23453.1 signal recognition particle-docking protein FtsY [Corynebacterium sp. HMSC056F09]
MNTTFLWIAIAVIVLILLVVLFVVLGKKRGESKKVSFEKPVEEPKELTQQQKSGNYQAKSGFNFAPAGGGATKEPVPAAKTEEPAPAEPKAQPHAEKKSEQRDATELANAQLKDEEETPKAAKPAAEPTPEAEPKPQAEPKPEPVADAKPVSTPEPAAQKEPAKEEEDKASSAGVAAAGAVGAAAAGAAVSGAAAVDKDEADTEEAVPASEPETAEPEPVAEAPKVEEEPSVQSEAEEEAEVEARLESEAPAESEEAEPEEAEAEEAAAAAGAQAASASAALEAEPEELEVSDDAEVVEAPAAQPQEDIAPAAGRLGKLRGRLSRSQNAIGQGLMGILSAGDLDDDAWEEIEDTLIMADLGTKSTMQVTDSLREKIAERGVSSEAEARAMLREALIEVGHPEMDRSIKAMPNDGKPAVIMVVGVNGTGKTTTTGKLARVLVSMGHNVLLGAADTFRAAAADQLETWGRRVGATTVRGKEGADPASVAFDAVAAGVDQGVDVVLVDTAGRLHTSVDLMDQLGKVKRVVEKKTEVDEVLLVLDATVGQNGLTQARIFRDVVDITGVVLTKLDGTAKGGIVFQVQEELGVPVKLVGLGEGADDLAPFEVEGFVDALLGEK